MQDRQHDADGIGSRSRTNSAPPATLHHALLAYAFPLVQECDSPSRRPLVQLISEIVSSPLYCEATSSIQNPREPKPFGLQLFPAYEGGRQSRCGGTGISDDGASVRERLTVGKARAFLEATNKKLNVHTTALDPRGSLANLALATLRCSSSQQSAAASPSHHAPTVPVAAESLVDHHRVPPCGELGSGGAAADDVDTLHFYKSKYLELVELHAREAEEIARERHEWERERDAARAREQQLEQKLLMAEKQAALLKETSERAVKHCNLFEEEIKQLRVALMESSESSEKFKEVAARQRQQLLSQQHLNRDLQGQLDLYRGNTSVPLFSQHPDVQILRSEKQQLEEENTKILTRLGTATKQFSADRKRLEAEIAELRRALSQYAPQTSAPTLASDV